MGKLFHTLEEAANIAGMSPGTFANYLSKLKIRAGIKGRLTKSKFFITDGIIQIVKDEQQVCQKNRGRKRKPLPVVI